MNFISALHDIVMHLCPVFSLSQMKDVGGWNYPRIHNEMSEASLAAGLWWFTHSLLKHLLTNTRGFGFGSSSIPGVESQRNSPNWQMISCREMLSSQSPANMWVNELCTIWHLKAMTHQIDIKVLATNKANCVVASKSHASAPKCCSWTHLKDTVNGQLACMFCSCVRKGNSPYPQVAEVYIFYSKWEAKWVLSIYKQ